MRVPVNANAKHHLSFEGFGVSMFKAWKTCIAPVCNEPLDCRACVLFGKQIHIFGDNKDT